MTIPNRNYTQIDTLELKALIVRKVGHQRADKYFDLLRRFFSLKISKSELNRFCIRTIGRGNIPLHNQLIRAILKNAFLAKVPPLTSSATAASVKVSNGQNVFHHSPGRGGCLAGQDCKLKKLKSRQSTLRPLGKPQSVAYEDLISKAQEQQSATELHSLGSRPPVSVEEGEEVEQVAGSPCIQSRSPVTAPLGISLNFGCGGKLLSNVSICTKYYPVTCQSSGDLPDTRSLTTRLEQKLEKEDLTVTVDGVNLLNNALDAYLKRLIESSTGLAASRLGNEHLGQLNGQSVAGSDVLLPGRYVQMATTAAAASLLDFRLAMELNPQVLGKDWPIQLEKIYLRAREESSICYQ